MGRSGYQQGARGAAKEPAIESKSRDAELHLRGEEETPRRCAPRGPLLLPVLASRISGGGGGSARRLHHKTFLSFQSKDKALDLICSKICGGVSVSKVQKSENPRVLVAFGNGGTVSTTGCAAMLLRHRLDFETDYNTYGVRIFR